MKQILDQLIQDAPKENDGAAELQLTISGTIYAGAVKPQGSKGCYMIMTVGQKPSPNGGAPQPIMVKTYFLASSVETISVAAEMSQIATPPSGLVISGAS